MRELIRLYVAASLVLVVFLLSMKALVACTPQDAKTVRDVKDVVVRIAEDICSEEAKQPDEPEWVALACAGEAVIHHVLMPRPEWRAMRARKRSPSAADGGLGR